MSAMASDLTDQKHVRSLVRSTELQEQLRNILSRRSNRATLQEASDELTWLAVLRETTHCGAHIAFACIKDISSRCSRLLVFAHGCRPVGLGLCADMVFSTQALDPLYLSLLHSGWAVGMTSYRREGICVKDGVLDVLDAIATAERFFGETFRTVVVEGQSMGGCIATLLAEQARILPGGSRLSGALTVGAALLTAEEGVSFSGKAVIPVLHLTTSDELGPLCQWYEQCKGSSSVSTAVWFVRRNGHCQCNAQERRAALEALLACIEESKVIPEFADTTVQPEEWPATTEFDDRGAWARVISTNIYGDIDTEFQPRDFHRLGILLGSTFLLAFHKTRFDSVVENARKMKYAAVDFMSTDVVAGGWFASDSPDGRISMSANGYVRVHKLTDDAGGIAVGDWVHVLRPVGIGAGLQGIPGGVLNML